MGRRKREGAPGGAAAARDPLDAVPVAHENVETAGDDAGNMHLRRKIEVRKGFFAPVARLLRLKRYKQLDLDKRGARFWRLIDGKRSLKTISSAMASECAADSKEMEKAVMLYTKALMLRGFVGLKIGSSNTHGVRKESR
jgi:hypothetical protein